MTFKKLIILTPLLLGACSSQFDFSKKAPDEFAVVTRAPLEMPSTNDLPTPRLGAQRPQEASPEQSAKAVLFGEVTAKEDLSSGESALLKQAGADNIDASIRTQIDTETQEMADENRSTFNRILGKVGKKTNAPVEVIDPVKERERLILEQQK